MLTIEGAKVVLQCLLCAGGSVMTNIMTGVSRVVWRRLRKPEEDTHDLIPLLHVSQLLGDFWSFNPKTTVSPKPAVHVHPLNLQEQRFVVIVSDGL